jgi:hypothetical protein
MWIFDSKGKRTEAIEENARQMIAEGGGFSALWPRGTPGEEAFEFAALCKDSSPAAALARMAFPRAEASAPPHATALRPRRGRGE